MAEQDTVASATLFCPGRAPAGQPGLGVQAWGTPSHDPQVSPVVPHVVLGAIPPEARLDGCLTPPPHAPRRPRKKVRGGILDKEKLFTSQQAGERVGQWRLSRVPHILEGQTLLSTFWGS